jgi:hypothetical protein
VKALVTTNLLVFFVALSVGTFPPSGHQAVTRVMVLSNCRFFLSRWRAWQTEMRRILRCLCDLMSTPPRRVLLFKQYFQYVQRQGMYSSVRCVAFQHGRASVWTFSGQGELHELPQRKRATNDEGTPEVTAKRFPDRVGSTTAAPGPICCYSAQRTRSRELTRCPDVAGSFPSHTALLYLGSLKGRQALFGRSLTCRPEEVKP